MDKLLNHSIAQIQKKNGEAVGGAFLVTKNQILTCAHVVRDALGLNDIPLTPPQDYIFFKFPFLKKEQQFRAKLIPEFWFPFWREHRLDIAGLEIDISLPLDTMPLIFCNNRKEELYDREFKAYGFPDGATVGVWTEGYVKDCREDYTIQLSRKIESEVPIMKGFSGSCVWDKRDSGVLGMITRSWDEYRIGSMIPANIILEIWPGCHSKACNVKLGNNNLTPLDDSNNPVPYLLVMSEFVNRSKELESIRYKLKKLRERQRIEELILTIRGVPGIGKTTFLKKIIEEANKQKVNSVFVDYNKKPNKIENELFFFQTVVEKCLYKDKEWENIFKFYHSKDGEGKRKFLRTELLNAFGEMWENKLHDIPTIIVIDNAQHISQTTSLILQEAFESIIDYNSLIVIVSSRAEFRWKSQKLRKRNENIFLERFGRSDTNALLNIQVTSNFNKLVYRITQGYPLACKEIYSWVNGNLDISLPNFTSLFLEKEPELVSRMVAQFLEKNFLNHLSDEGSKKRIIQLIRILSPLRRLEDELISAISQKKELAIEANEFFPLNDVNEVRTYKNLLINYSLLTRWDSSKKEYSLDYPIRHLLSLDKELHAKNSLIEFHRFVKDWYEVKLGEMASKADYSHDYVIYLIEYVFHFAKTQKLTNQKYLFESAIKAFINSQFKNKKSHIPNDFKEEFSKDMELKELLGEDFYRLQEFVESPATTNK